MARDVADDVVGKRVQFDAQTWQALDLLARDRVASFQDLADEAFDDLLRKHDRPVGLRAALKKSARTAGVERKRGSPARGKHRAKSTCPRGKHNSRH